MRRHSILAFTVQLCDTLTLRPCLFDFPVDPEGPVPVPLQDHSGSQVGEPALGLEMLAACLELEVASHVPSGAVHREEIQAEAIPVLALL